MVSKIGQVVLAVQVGGPKVDPELAGDRSVDRAGAAIGARCAGLFLGREPFHFEIAWGKRAESAG